MKSLEVIGLSIFGLVASTIGVCVALMVLSMTLEAVTGIRLIETYIKPIFGH